MRQNAIYRKKRILPFVSVLLLLLVGVVLLGDFSLLWARTHMQAFSQEFGQAVNALDALAEDPRAAITQSQQHLTTARAELDTLRPVAEPIVSIADNLTNLPIISEPAGQLIYLWNFANESSTLAETLLNTAELGLNNLESSGFAGLLTTMPELQQQLRAAEAGLFKTQSTRDQLDNIGWLPNDMEKQIYTSLARWDVLAPRFEKTLSSAHRLTWMVSTALDQKKPATYLILVQSSDELRATGGFITGVGTIRIEQGKVTQVTISDVQEAEEQRAWTDKDWVKGVSGPDIYPPPPPFTRYMGLGHWVLRDANWWADFPATAQQVNNFWRLANDTPLDGVIALNAQSVADLLAIAGPIETPDGRVIGAKNVQGVAAENVSPSNQSMFFQDLAFALAVLPEKIPPDRLLELGSFLQRAAARRDVQITGFDPAVNAVFRTLGLDGSLQGQVDDYFYLVEDNVSYNKLSPFIEQNLKYDVYLDPDATPSLAMLTIDKTNTYAPGAGIGYPEKYYDGGRWNEITRQVDHWPGYYGGYTRLFLPIGSRFLEVAGLDDGPDIATENSHTVIGGYTGLHPNNPRQLWYRWIPNKQPGTPGQYRLMVQRQPGAPDHPLTVEVHLPPGYQATNIDPNPAKTTDNTITWHTTLDKDQTFLLQLEASQDFLTSIGLTPTPWVIAASAPAAPVTSVDTHQAAPPSTIAARSVAPAPAPIQGRKPKPVWLSIPAIAVSAPVVPVGLEPSGIMASPSEADIVAWFELGPRPGEPSNAVVSGHVNWQGEIGVFARLHELQKGDTITIQNGPGSGTEYVVETIETYQAETAPVTEIFGGTVEPVLTLITCGGPYDAQRQIYRDRLVVRARGS